MEAAAAAVAVDDALCDHTLEHVASFLDYHSAVTLSRETCTGWRRRLTNYLFREIFNRHYFCPPSSPSVDVNYRQECKERKQLMTNLVGKSDTSLKKQNPFNLPNRFFYFMPITPRDDDDDAMQLDDPPPVDFDCDSFILLDGAMSGELLVLDPFDMSLVTYKNCLENAIASDEAMMRQAWNDAASAVTMARRRHPSTAPVEAEQHIAGAVIDEAVYRNHNVEHYQTPPSQVLLQSEAYYEVQLQEYFQLTNDRHAPRRTNDGSLFLHPADEVEFGYMAIDSKPTVDEKGQPKGTMVGLGRFLCSLQIDATDHISCTELITWKRRVGEEAFGDKRICRVPWDVLCADNCPKLDRIYVVHFRGQGPLPRSNDDAHIDPSSSSSPMGRKVVHVYPLLPFEESSLESPRYFPKPISVIVCSYFVSYVIVDAVGTLVVGTHNGYIEMWKLKPEYNEMRRVSILNVKGALSEAAKRSQANVNAITPHEPSGAMESETTNACNDQVIGAVDMTMHAMNDGTSGSEANESVDGSVVEMDNENAVPPNESESSLPRLFGSPEVESIRFPNHIPIDQCGFITLHHSRVDGTSLLLFKKPSVDSDFQVVTQINLPLSSRRKPCVHYDGRRIIVCGQDHIGLIVLVYHVLCSMEDIDYFPSSGDNNNNNPNGDDSGGVYNYTLQPQVRFANRIRHAAFGGLQYYDSLYMTCNERFIIVNTKTGNLLGGASPTAEGLLIIDLREPE